MAKNRLYAAGGVVCRPADDGGLDVLLVGGAADNSDYWGFPKGKQDQGEPIEATAVREVGEETGIRVELLALGMFFGASSNPRFQKNQERLSLLSEHTIAYQGRAEIIEQEIAEQESQQRKPPTEDLQPRLL